MANKNVTYVISLKDKMSKKVDNLDKRTSKFEKTLGTLGKTLIAGAVAFGIKKAIVGIGKLGAEMEQTEIAFGTFLGSAEKGRKVIEELNEFANVTPFDNEEILKSGRVLLAANVPAEQLGDTLQRIGDVAAGSNVPINELASIYAKAMNKGKLQAEELNQLAERGIPIIDVLSKEFGVTKQEVFELGSKGKITSREMKSAFKTMTKEGGIFFNLMKKQSESAIGLMSTLQGKMKLAGIELGKKMLPAAKKATKAFIGLADALIRTVKVPYSETLQKTRAELNAEFDVLKKGNITVEQRRNLIGDINAKYKDYLPNLLNEKSSIDDITIAQNAANRALLKRIEIQAKQEILQDAVEKVARTNKKLFEEQMFREEQLNIAAESSGQVRANALRASFGSLDKIRKLEIKKFKREGELATLQSSLGDLALGVDSTGATKGIGQIQGALEQSGLTKITARTPKVFNININNLVETFNVNTTTLKEGAIDIRKQIEQTLAEAIADVQAIPG